MSENPYEHVEINVPDAAPWPAFKTWLTENHIEAIWNLDVAIVGKNIELSGSVHSEAAKAEILERARAHAPACQERLLVEGVFVSASSNFDDFLANGASESDDGEKDDATTGGSEYALMLGQTAPSEDADEWQVATLQFRGKMFWEVMHFQAVLRTTVSDSLWVSGELAAAIRGIRLPFNPNYATEAYHLVIDSDEDAHSAWKVFSEHAPAILAAAEPPDGYCSWLTVITEADAYDVDTAPARIQRLLNELRVTLATVGNIVILQETPLLADALNLPTLEGEENLLNLKPIELEGHRWWVGAWFFPVISAFEPSNYDDQDLDLDDDSEADADD